ncbi:MAG TPA: cyclic nucleotide-binding domain-containing protein [Bryobacteraceae bacterium]|nr:cyclic nucleotide-binding domain-containing protein [Bryobacteraceae bacterium]
MNINSQSADAVTEGLKAMELVKGLLTNQALTHALSRSQISRLAAVTSEVAYPSDAIILEGAQPSTSIYIIMAGTVVVELRKDWYTVGVQVLGAGQMFGWSALLGSRETMFQVRVQEAATMLQIDGAALEETFRTDPILCREILQGLLRAMADRLKASELKIAELCGTPVKTSPCRIGVGRCPRTSEGASS